MLTGQMANSTQAAGMRAGRLLRLPATSGVRTAPGDGNMKLEAIADDGTAHLHPAHRPQTGGAACSMASQPADTTMCETSHCMATLLTRFGDDADDGPAGREPCFKTALNMYCQRVVRRSLTKSDIVYDLVDFGEGGHQAVVTVACLGGLVFAGQLADTPKQAVELAAQQVLDYHGIGLAKRASKAAGSKFASLVRKRYGLESNPALTPKVILNTLCSRVSDRPLVKGDTVYTSLQTNGGFQATVTVSVLPSPWQLVQWIGVVCDTKQEAEQKAAAAALECLIAVEDFSRLLDKKQRP